MSQNRSTRNFTERDVPEQHGRTFLVTGANAGIGYETAKVLARRNRDRQALATDIGIKLRARPGVIRGDISHRHGPLHRRSEHPGCH